MKKILSLASFFLPLGLYILTVARTITGFGDSAEFAADSFTFQAAHPSGYPLHIIIGKIFTLIPFISDSPAFKVNLASVLLASFACLIIYKILILLETKPIISLLATLILASSYSFWLFATVFEVFMLNTFFFILLIYLFLHFSLRPTPYKLHIIAFVYGLAFTGHLSIALLAPAGAYLVLTTDKHILKGHIITLSLAFLSGLVPYLLVLYSGFVPHYPFFGITPGLTRFFQYIGRVDYGGITSAGVQTSPSLTNYWGLYFYFLKSLFSQFTFLAPIAAIIFIIKTLIHREKTQIFLTIILVITVLIFPINYLKGIDDADLHVMAVSEKFFISGFVALLLVFVSGLKSYWIFKKEKILAFTLAAIIPINLVTNLPSLNKADYNLQKNYALNILNQAEDGSIIFSSDDMTSFALRYFISAEKVKPNVRIINISFLNSRNYQKELKSYWPDLYKTTSYYTYDIVADIISTNQGSRNVYFVMLDDPYPFGFDGNPYFFTPQGLLLKADLKAKTESVTQENQDQYWQKYNLKGLTDNYSDPTAKLTVINYAFRRKINAKIFLSAGCLSCAQKELNEALKITPEDKELKNDLNQLNLPNTKAKTSVKDYLDSAKNLINSSGFRFNLNLNRAIYDLQQAEKLDSNNEEVHGTIAELYEFFGIYDKAIDEYDAAAKINPKEDWQIRADTVRSKAPKEY